MPKYTFEDITVTPLRQGQSVRTSYQGDPYVAGLDDYYVNLGYVKLVMSGNQIHGTSMTFQTAAPIITQPIPSGSTSVSGVVTAPNGSEIAVYVDAVGVAVTTVVNGSANPDTVGTWSVTGLTALEEDQVVTAQCLSTYAGAQLSELSAPITVLRTDPPVIGATIHAGATSVAGTSTENNGTTIELFKNAVSVGTTTVTANAWTKTGLTALVEGQELTAIATATADGKGPSELSDPVTVVA